jgi:hypothetical protein
MSYFTKFPNVLYSFGDERERASFQNMALYVEVIDKLKDNASFYNDHYIRDGQRADNVSNTLYGDPSYHWTFYLMNDKLREHGWPLDRLELDKKIKEDFPNLVLKTDDEIFTIFKVGQTVQGNSGQGTIAYRNLDLGQVVLKDVTGSFADGELVTSNDGAESITVTASMSEYLATHHYNDDVPVTNYEHYQEKNDGLRSISVIRKDVIRDITRLFSQAMNS